MGSVRDCPCNIDYPAFPRGSWRSLAPFGGDRNETRREGKARITISANTRLMITGALNKRGFTDFNSRKLDKNRPTSAVLNQSGLSERGRAEKPACTTPALIL